MHNLIANTNIRVPHKIIKPNRPNNSFEVLYKIQSKRFKYIILNHKIKYKQRRINR